MQDLTFILPATVVLYQKYRKHIIAKQANVTAAVFLKNIQIRSATMLTVEALVKEKNVSAPICPGQSDSITSRPEAQKQFRETTGKEEEEETKSSV
eukprot:1633036-Ditylum_brightwellii.AAC.1